MKLDILPTGNIKLELDSNHPDYNTLAGLLWAKRGGKGTFKASTNGHAKKAAEPAALPAPSPDKLIEVPDIRQHDVYSCGAAASMSVGRYFGVGPETLDDWKKALGTTEKDSTQPGKIAEYLESLGLQVVPTFGMSVDDLKRCHAEGKPVICPLKEYGDEKSKGAEYAYGHYLVVIGVGFGTYVFCQDPSSDNVLEGEGSLEAPGRVMIRADKWMNVWHDEDVAGNEYRQFGIIVGPGKAGKPGSKIEAAKVPEEKGIKKDWITLHGGGDEHGGTHIFVDDGGKITAGPARLEGKPLSRLPKTGNPFASKPKKKPDNHLAKPTPEPKPTDSEDDTVSFPTDESDDSVSLPADWDEDHEPKPPVASHDSPEANEARDKTKEHFATLLKNNGQSLKDSKAAAALKHLDAAISKMTKPMLDKLQKRVGKLQAHDSTVELTELMGRLSGQKLSKGAVQGAFQSNFDDPSGTLHLDHPELEPEQTAAHELGHAIDYRHEHSDSKEWKEAWQSEINTDAWPISIYATSNASEGLAEFFAAMQMHPDKMHKFPKCMVCFKKWGYI